MIRKRAGVKSAKRSTRWRWIHGKTVLRKDDELSAASNNPGLNDSAVKGGYITAFDLGRCGQTVADVGSFAVCRRRIIAKKGGKR
jgi:hypothetical protein